MTSKPVVLRFLITELPTLVEQKSKQVSLNDKPKPMSLPGTSWIKPNIYRFNRWRWQHVSEKFRLLFSKANSNYCNAKNREIWPQGLDLGGSTASNWRTSAQIKTLRPYFLTLIYQSYQSIIFFLFRGIFQPSKLHLFVGNFKNNRIEILPAWSF